MRGLLYEGWGSCGSSCTRTEGEDMDWFWWILGAYLAGILTAVIAVVLFWTKMD